MDLHFLGIAATDFIVQSNRFDETVELPAVMCEAETIFERSNIFATDPATAVGLFCLYSD